MMWLVLMVDILGVTTTPMDMVPRGASEATSNSSGVRRQAVTPAKPCGGVVGCTTANACTGKEGFGGVGVFDGEAGSFTGTVWGAELVPLLALRPWMVGRSPQWPRLVRMDAEFFPPQKLWASPLHGCLWYTGCLGDIS